MRCVLFLFILVTAQLCRAEGPFDRSVFSPKAEWEAVFTKVHYPESRREGTKVTVRERWGDSSFEQELIADVASSAEWTHDGKFLVVTAQNGGGHSPWHYRVYVFSLAAGEWRRYEEPKDTPVIVSAEMFFQSMHTVIFIGHTFEHHLSAPDDPVLLRFDLAELWPKLERV